MRVRVSAFPALIDVFPYYRDDSFFVTEDQIVFVNPDRRIVDVVPIGGMPGGSIGRIAGVTIGQIVASRSAQCRAR